MARLKLLECGIELELAAIDKDTPGKAMRSQKDLPIQAIPMTFEGHPNTQVCPNDGCTADALVLHLRFLGSSAQPLYRSPSEGNPKV